MTSLFEPLTFSRGPAMKNRFLLAPLTNQQAPDDGSLSEDELNWLRKRAEGGFSHVMTCCAHVNHKGQGFPGELGAFGDELIPGLSRLSNALRVAGSVSSVQLYHGGLRSIMPDRVAPSASPEDNARELTIPEIQAIVQDFVAGAVRVERAGFDGIELHGAHGYLISEFLSTRHNLRQDEYGGTPEKRRRFILEIVDGIRKACGKDFQIGIRVSPERFGIDLMETVELCQLLIDEGKIEYLDISLWDVFKDPEDAKYKGKSLMSYFTGLALKDRVRLGVAGKIHTYDDSMRCLDAGVDFVVVGRAAIMHHDLPLRLQKDSSFTPLQFPVSADYLRNEGLGEAFICYLATWPNMVTDYVPPAEMPRFDAEEFFKTGRSVKLAGD